MPKVINQTIAYLGALQKLVEVSGTEDSIDQLLKNTEQTLNSSAFKILKSSIFYQISREEYVKRVGLPIRNIKRLRRSKDFKRDLNIAYATAAALETYAEKFHLN
jgi:hypothetical protein